MAIFLRIERLWLHAAHQPSFSTRRVLGVNMSLHSCCTRSLHHHTLGRPQSALCESAAPPTTQRPWARLQCIIANFTNNDRGVPCQWYSSYLTQLQLTFGLVSVLHTVFWLGWHSASQALWCTSPGEKNIMQKMKALLPADCALRTTFLLSPLLSIVVLQDLFQWPVHKIHTHWSQQVCQCQANKIPATTCSSRKVLEGRDTLHRENSIQYISGPHITSHGLIPHKQLWKRQPIIHV